MGQAARDKERDAVGQPLQTGPGGLRCSPANRWVGDGRGKPFIHERKRTDNGKIQAEKKRGFPSKGNRWRKGLLIFLFLARFKDTLFFRNRVSRAKWSGRRADQRRSRCSEWYTKNALNAFHSHYCRSQSKTC